MPKRYLFRLKSDETENSDLNKMWHEIEANYQNWEKYPFKEKEKIDERRKEIGLPSLETLYNRVDKQLPKWYQSILEKEHK